MKRKYKLRVRGRMLNTKLLGAECSAPPGLALLKRRQQLDESQLTTVGRLAFLLQTALPIYIIALSIRADSWTTMITGLVIAAPFFPLQFCVTRVFRKRNCILTGDVRCYLARVKNYHKPYADIEFPSGRIKKRFLVYTGDGKPIKPGDEVYVCVIEYKSLQFCEVRPVSELGKAPNRKSRKKKKA